MDILEKVSVLTPEAVFYLYQKASTTNHEMERIYQFAKLVEKFVEEKSKIPA